MSLGGISGGLVGDVASGGSVKPSENEDSSNRAKRGRGQASGVLGRAVLQ